MTRKKNTLVAEAMGDPFIGLTDKQKIFIDAVCHGQTQTMAARSAGYEFPGPEAVRLMKIPKIKEALQYQHRKYEKATQMTRRRVMDGLVEAVEMAKVQADPGTMVNGWREIGRMCGYYAAEKKVIDINITAKRAVDKLEMMSDAELLEMIENDSEAIEGEYAEVLDATQDVADARYAENGL
jgi:phage terminase small subunit